MAEYIECEKVTELIDYYQEDYFEAEAYFGLLKEDFLKLPSADVQPVVRCINCKNYEGLACCKLIGDCGGTNWFCGWGEPRGET